MKGSSSDNDSNRLVPHEPKIIVPSSSEEAQRLIQESTTGLKTVRDVQHFALLEKTQLDEQVRLMQAKSVAYHFERSEYSDVSAFFYEASKDYDSDLENPYWAFTHEILRFILKKFIAEHFRETSEIRVFDAGAGTGNWSKFILGFNENISGILFDMNPKMLRVAYPKVMGLRGNSVRVIEGNLEVWTDFPSERSNLILCMHNVIGMGRNTNLILSNLYLYLEEGGLAFIMAPNKYHAFNFTREFRNEAEVLRVVRDGTVKFKTDMPEMFCYTPQEFENILLTVGFGYVTVLGFPVTVYPSPRDTKLRQKDTTDRQLKNPQERAALLDLEKRLCLEPELAYRGGSSLIAICEKEGSVHPHEQVEPPRSQ